MRAGLLHQREEARLVALVGALPGALLHRRTSGVGLEAAAPPAGAAPAAGHAHGMADLTAGAQPALADHPVEEQRAPDPGAEPHREDVMERSSRTEAVLADQRDAHVVVDGDGHTEPALELSRAAGSSRSSRGCWGCAPPRP